MFGASDSVDQAKTELRFDQCGAKVTERQTMREEMRSRTTVRARRAGEFVTDRQRTRRAGRSLAYIIDCSNEALYRTPAACAVRHCLVNGQRPATPALQLLRHTAHRRAGSLRYFLSPISVDISIA